ncbi:protein kinase domain-containing protein [Ditylenchus destructor]|nr:protein kinase domain-containing protein [Ditylenchus destructor]
MGLEADQKAGFIKGKHEAESVQMVNSIGSPHKNFAMKCYSSNKLEYFKKEVRLLRAFQWDYIASISGYFKLGKSYCYLLERYKETLQNAKLTDREKLDKFNEILSTVDYLHKHGLTHGDLKADNVMIDNRGVVKVIDFDASRSFDRKGCLGGNVFTWSPEFFLNKQNCDSRSADYWGLGTTLLRIWTGDDDELLSIFLYMTWNTSELRKSTQQLSELIEKILKDMDGKHSSNEWSLSKQIIQLLLGGNAEERTNNFNKVKQLLVSNGYKVSFLASM